MRIQNLREELFRAVMWLKGPDGVLELLGGAALFAVSPSFIVRTVGLLTQDKIIEDPRDLVANYLRRAVGHLSLSGEYFMAIYLIIHGVVKVALVWALLKRKLRVYPLDLILFAGLVGYQLYRFTITHGLGLMVLTGVDLAVIVLIYIEYRALRRPSGRAVQKGAESRRECS